MREYIFKNNLSEFYIDELINKNHIFELFDKLTIELSKYINKYILVNILSINKKSIEQKIEYFVLSYITKNFSHIKIKIICSNNEYILENNPIYIIYLKPIDGIENLQHNIPIYSISIVIELIKNKELLILYTKNLNTNEKFYYIKNKGIYYNNNLFNKNKKHIINNSYNLHISVYNDYNNIFSKYQNINVKNIGCLSIELFYILIGFLDGYVNFNLKNIKYIDIKTYILILKESKTTYSNINIHENINIENILKKNIIIISSSKNIYLYLLKIINLTNKNEFYCYKIKTVLLLYDSKNLKSINILNSLHNYLKKKNINVLQFTNESNNYIKKKIQRNFFDIIIVIGGDGTLLYYINNLKSNIPIIGINVGTVGFLADINSKKYLTIIKNIINNGYKYKSYNKIELIINNISYGDAINEIIITSFDYKKIISYDLFINNYFIKSIRSDGILISTSIGSTAHALSYGGPLIHPDISVFEIIPIAPFTLIDRPFIIETNNIIMIKINESYKNVIFLLDGKKIINDNKILIAGNKDTIIIKKSENIVNFVNLSDLCFYKKINKKLYFDIGSNKKI